MSEGLLPGGKKDKRLTWEETYRETAREKEDWSDLEKYTGTLLFVSRDREFVSSLATRIIELRPGAAGGAATLIDFRGGYEDYLAGAGVELAAA
jgi:hypothetical protein